MNKIHLSRRDFLKVTAATGAVGALATGTAATALADSSEAPAAVEVKRIRTGCRGCGKVECGVWVTVQNGRAIKVEGDESAWATQGNCCIKAQASMQAMYHPDRLRYPMKRTNPKGSADPGWQRITWDEAFDLVHKNLGGLVDKYTTRTFCRKSGTSRIWGNHGGKVSQLWPNDETGYIGGIQVCKGPRNFVGRVTTEGQGHFMSCNDYPKTYVQWGTDETQSNYDDAGRVVAEAIQRAKVFISVDPRKSNAGKEADIHLPLRPGSDNAMALAWTHIVMDRELYDDNVCRWWTNAPFLVSREIEPSGWVGVKYNRSPRFEVSTKLLKETDVDPETLPWEVEGEGNPRHFLIWDELNDKLTYFDADESSPHAGMWEGQTEFNIPTTGFTYDRGGWVPDFPANPDHLLPSLWCGEGYPVKLKDGREIKVKTVWQTYWDEDVNDMTLERAAEITGCNADDIEKACLLWAKRQDPRYGNGINYNLGPEQEANCYNNFRALMVLTCMMDAWDVPGSHRGATRNPLDASGNRAAKWPSDPRAYTERYGGHPGTDKFPLLRWSGDMMEDATSYYRAMFTGDPYPVRAFLEFASGMCQQSNVLMVYEAYKSLDFHFSYDLWHTVGNGNADVLLPAMHWMEIPGFPRKSQNATGNLGANQNCVKPIGDVKFDPEITIGIYKAFGVPWYDVNDGKGDAWDRPFTAQLDNMVKSSGMTWEQYADKFQKEGWWDNKVLQPEQWGTYRRYLMGYCRSRDGGYNANWKTEIPGFSHPTMKMEIWATISESLTGGFELPMYQEPPISILSTPDMAKEYPLTMTTGARVSSYFHSEHRQLPWCREVAPVPLLYINPADAEKYGLKQGDWAWVETHKAKIRLCVNLSHGVKPGVMNADHHWWYPELSHSERGFRLSNVNCLVDEDAQDPVFGSSEIRGYLVKVYKATPENSPFGNPVPCDYDGTEIIHDASDPRLKKWESQINEIATDNSKWEVYAK